MAPASALRWKVPIHYRRSVSRSRFRLSSSTLLRRPHPCNKWQGFPAHPPPHSPFPRETARSSAISSPNTATAESPAPSHSRPPGFSSSRETQNKLQLESHYRFSSAVSPFNLLRFSWFVIPIEIS